MRKKVIHFTKYRTYTFILSLLLIAGGIVGMGLLGGFNLGIDFQAGLSQRIQITEEALSLTYAGSDDATLDISGGTVQLTVRGATGLASHSFPADEYETVSRLAEGLGSVEGVAAEVIGNGNAPVTDIVTGLSLPYELGSDPVALTVANSDTDQYISIDEVRAALSEMDIAQVQVVGETHRQEFQVRAAAAAEGSKEELEDGIRSLLRSEYGENSVIVKGSDYVGPKFSAALSASAVLLVIVALVLILLYIWFRFKFAYAVSALSALVHDILIMLGFIAVAQLEVSTTTIAAVLTIIGYSLNDTIVVFDRIRENMLTMQEKSLSRIINRSITQSLSRTLVTSLTTLLAVIPLYIFATGGIKLFALNLIVGIIVGTYSSIFVASPVLLILLKRQQAKKAEHLGKEAIADDADETEAAEAAPVPGQQKPAEVEIQRVERKKKRGKRKK